jgi:hypothetical protein
MMLLAPAVPAQAGEAPGRGVTAFVDTAAAAPLH